MRPFHFASAAVLTALMLVIGQPQARAFSAWQLPLAHTQVVHEYLQPASDYSAGHRGVDLLTKAAEKVFAAADGEVTFAGRVVDRSVITIAHAGSLKTSYEPVCSTLAKGEKVAVGESIGSMCFGSGYLSHCGVRTCLHFSLRTAAGYLSPLAQIGSLSPSRLIPVAQARG